MIRHKLWFSDIYSQEGGEFIIFENIPFRLNKEDKVVTSDLLGYEYLKSWLLDRNLQHHEFKVVHSYVCKDENGFYLWVDLQ